MAKSFLVLLLTQAAAGSALTILLLVVRRLFKKHVRPGLMYGAWLLVAIRLMLPLSIASPLLPARQYMQTPVVKAPSAQVQTLAQDTAPLTPLVNRQEAAINAPVPAPSSGISLESFLLLLWGSGVLLTSSFMAAANRRLMKSARLRPVDLPGIKYPVYLSCLPSPCVLKVFRPVIALTESSMRPENLRYALLHETCHLLRGDLKWSLLRNILCAAFWFSPLVWLAAAASRRDCELSLDETVKHSLNRDERFEYAQTLLRLAGRPMAFTAAAMLSRKRDLKERLERIMESSLPKRSVSVFISVLLCLTCLISFATAGKASMPPEITPPPAGMQADASETVLPASEYIKRAWGMDELNYNDLLMNMDTRVKNRQIYLCTGTVTALIGSEPQLVTMQLRKSALYVVLENATGTDWELGTAYKVFADADGKYTDMPKIATFSRVDHMPRLKARYSYIDADNYSVNELQDKLDGLEKKFGTGSANASVFHNRLGSFDPDDLCMMNFVKALMKVETAEEYDALLHTRFPGINEAYPGYDSMPLAQLRVMVDSMFLNAMGVDVSIYPWRYEACAAPGLFDIRLGKDSSQIRYNIQMHLNVAVYIDTVPTKEELESQTILAIDQIPGDTLQKAMETARKFAASYLMAGLSETVISPAKTPLAQGSVPGKVPVQFNLLIPEVGYGYKMIVDLDTMRVVEAEYCEMETGKDGNVVPKYDSVQMQIVPLP